MTVVVIYVTKMRVPTPHGRGLGVSSPHFAAISRVFPFGEIKSMLFHREDVTMDKMTCWTVFPTSQAPVMVLEASNLQAAVRREVVFLEWLRLTLKEGSVM